MDMNADAMVSAVQEVTSVAEELRALRDRVKQYGDASKRLADFSDILNDLNNSLVRIKEAFSGAFDQAKHAQEIANEGKRAVEGLVASVPEVVKRIEATDVGKSIDAFSAAMEQLGQLLDSHQKSVVQLSTNFSEEREGHAAKLNDITERIERVMAGVSHVSVEIRVLQDSVSQQAQSLQGLSNVISCELSPLGKRNAEAIAGLKSVVSEVQRDSGKGIDAMAEFSAKMLREMAAMRDELGGAKQMLEVQGKAIAQQAQALDDLSKKKRGFFG